MSLRVAVVAPYDLSAPGGVNTQIRGQARALRALGHSVDVFGPASGPLTDGEQSLGRAVAIAFGGTESGLGVDPRGFAAVGRLARGPFDVIHVHEPLTPLVPWLVIGAARAPLVGTFHVHRESGHRLYALWKGVLGPLIRRLRARIAVSDAARRTVATHFPGDYEIVPNGIDVDDFRRARPRPRALIGGRRSVVCVGRLEPRKGVDTLVRAMALVRETAPDVLLVIVGDGSERAALAALAGNTDTVQFAGEVADAELAAYVQAADVVCSPALGGESFGIVLLEAMACGKPIVASRIEGYEALVGSTGGARLVPPGDVTALARELTSLLMSPDERRHLGQAGAVAARAYDWTVIGRRLEDIYRRVDGDPRNDGDQTRLRSIK
jgi:phosphatidyl-myo-inositol alpha-mannosyltransferase